MPKIASLLVSFSEIQEIGIDCLNAKQSHLQSRRKR